MAKIPGLSDDENVLVAMLYNLEFTKLFECRSEFESKLVSKRINRVVANAHRRASKGWTTA